MNRQLLTTERDRLQSHQVGHRLDPSGYSLRELERTVPPTDQAERWREYVATRMSRLRGDSVTVEPTARRTHPHSTIFEFMISGGGEAPYTVLLKIPSLPLQPRSCATVTSGARPRLFEPMESRLRAECEYAALIHIDSYFRQLGDPRFATVRPLDLATDTGTILMQKIPAASLKRLLARTHRWRRSADRETLAQAFRHTGAWLRIFHQSPLPSHTQRQQHCGQSFALSMHRISEYLKRVHGEPAFFERLSSESSAAAERLLATAPPAGLAHCDYAPRNVLVGPAAQVAVIDTAARWQAPIYMDIAYFLVNLKATQAQIYSWGWMRSERSLAEHEQAFLHGYFGTSVPWRVLRLYELQALVDRWAATTERLVRQATGGNRSQGSTARAKLWISGRYFRHQTAALLHSIGGS